MPHFKPAAGPPAWYDWNGTRYYRVQSGYYQSREKSGYRRMHVVVWEWATGQSKPEGFVIHHRNEDRGDNRPENLELMSKGDHNRHHQWGTVRDAAARARIAAGAADSWTRRSFRTCTCEECGGTFSTRSGRTPRWCSKACRSRKRRRLRREGTDG